MVRINGYRLDMDPGASENWLSTGLGTDNIGQYGLQSLKTENNLEFFWFSGMMDMDHTGQYGSYWYW